MFNVNSDKYNVFHCGETLGTHIHSDGIFPPCRPNYTKTEDIEYTKGLLNETIVNLRKFQERMTKEYESLCAKITNDNVYFKTAMNEAFKSFNIDVQNEINNFETNVDNTIALFQNSSEAEIADYVKTLDEKYANTTTTLATQFTELKTNLLKAIQELNVAQNKKIDDSIKSIQEDIEEQNIIIGESVLNVPRTYSFKITKTASGSQITASIPNNDFIRKPFVHYTYDLKAVSDTAPVTKIGTWDMTLDEATDIINLTMTVAGTIASATNVDIYFTLIAYPTCYSEETEV